MDDAILPGISDRQHRVADAARHLRREHDVHPERENRQHVRIPSAYSADEDHLDEQRDDRGRRHADEHRGEEPEVALRARDDVDADQQDRAVREVDHPAGFEDEREPEDDERVDEAERQAADEQLEELVMLPARRSPARCPR